MTTFGTKLKQRRDALARLLRMALGSEAREVIVKMRDCDDVPNFLKKFDAIQTRTAKSKLRFGMVKSS